MSLATVASVVGIGSGINSLTGGSLFGGGGGGGGGGASTYVPTGLGGADQQWQQWLQQIASNLGGMQQFGGVPGNAFSAMLNLDPSILSRAGGQAGGLYSGLVPQAQNVSTSMSGMGDLLSNMGQSVWQAGADPQGDLYKRTAQRVQDSSRAASSARGIGMSGEAAGLENQAMGNFNMDWNNQQLGRMLSSLQGAGSAFQGAGGLYGGALGAGAMAPQFAMQSGAVPWGASSTAAGWPLQAMGQYLPIIAAMNQQYGAGMGQINPYMYGGQGATGQAFGQQQTGLNNVTSGLDQLARIFNRPTIPSAGTINYGSGGAGGLLDNAYG